MKNSSNAKITLALATMLLGLGMTWNSPAALEWPVIDAPWPGPSAYGLPVDCSPSTTWFSETPFQFGKLGPNGWCLDFLHRPSLPWLSNCPDDYDDWFMPDNKLPHVFRMLDAPVVPEPSTVIAAAFLLLPLGLSVLRIFRHRRSTGKIVVTERVRIGENSQ